MIGMKSFRSAERQSPRQRQGRRFEDLALAHLRQHGLELVTRNYWCRVGELDLVMRERDTLVFVEVRYRHGTGFGSALASVVRGKQTRVIHAARHFLLRYPSYAAWPCRFDVVALTSDRDATRIEWVAAAFT
jgi:putative endonuclease